ncbi:MAG: ferritin-like domain-containing protein [Novosphingobium sp.]|nr:ferritin-like domain-containing protein [Novosphingobium sp.]MCB2078388.1 ferritin-like domain-containing protein [Novosphingobium sp.]
MIGRRRFLDVLASLYIYNEHRGYSSIDRVLEAVRRKCPDETEFIEAVEKHRRDERKHYLMFKRYFEKRGQMPFAVGRGCGHIDRLIGLTFRTTIDELDTDAVVASDAMFKKLCRIIILTEQRGQRQLDSLLLSPAALSDPMLIRIFEVIREDEPSHWQPYQYWLDKHGGGGASWAERAADWLVHQTLLLVKLPLMFFTPGLARRITWHDADDPE